MISQPFGNGRSLSGDQGDKRAADRCTIKSSGKNSNYAVLSLSGRSKWCDARDKKNEPCGST